MYGSEHLRATLNRHTNYDHDSQNRPGNEAKQRSAADQQPRIDGSEFNQPADPDFDARRIVTNEKSGDSRRQHL